MKWKCNRCGHEQPRHPLTQSVDMPICIRPMPQLSDSELAKLPPPDHDTYYRIFRLNGYFPCAGKPQPI